MAVKKEIKRIFCHFQSIKKYFEYLKKILGMEEFIIFTNR